MNRKPTICPTRICTYLECPLKYRFIYVDRVGDRYVCTTPQESFDATMHQVLQEFHGSGASESLQVLLARYERAWISAGYEFPEDEAEYKLDGIEMLMAYHAAVTRPDRPPFETIMLARSVAYDMGPFVLEGNLDRVDRHADGTLEIIEYKTSKVAANAAVVAEDIRMGIYQLILRKLYPDSKVIATIFDLRTTRAASAQLTSQSLFTDDILSLGEELLARDFDAARPARSPLCDNCGFMPLCERVRAGYFLAARFAGAGFFAGGAFTKCRLAELMQ